MIILGIILLIVGFVIGFHLLIVLGIILALVGVALLLLGRGGHAVGGRSHYW
jgi:hypothetical protein